MRHSLGQNPVQLMPERQKMRQSFDTKLLGGLHGIIRWAVRALALLMVFVIIMGVVDVGWLLYERLISPPVYILTISDMLATFGAFMAVLIAIEIFINITVYLRDNVIHVKIVMATALMAIARKVIVLDLEKVSPAYLWGIASIVLAVSLAYLLVHFVTEDREIDGAKGKTSSYPGPVR